MNVKQTMIVLLPKNAFPMSAGTRVSIFLVENKLFAEQKIMVESVTVPQESKEIPW